MNGWQEISEFCKSVGLNEKVVDVMVKKGELKSKVENDKTYIKQNSTSVVVSSQDAPEILNEKNDKFAKHAIGTILDLHEQVIDAKDETVEALKSENRFLKESLFSLQELYDEDRKTIEALQKQLEISQKEVEFLKRKYKLMWNRTIENYKKDI